ncbi:MAG: hypothetical protein WCL19_06945 [Verrucomicrobiota bacterium]|jgi:hypothetical protein
MSLDISKLELVRIKHGRGTSMKKVAQCPACAEEGGDSQGIHLVIFPDGKFSCIKYPGASGKKHRQRIHELAGDGESTRKRIDELPGDGKSTRKRIQIKIRRPTYLAPPQKLDH